MLHFEIDFLDRIGNSCRLMIAVQTIMEYFLQFFSPRSKLFHDLYLHVCARNSAIRRILYTADTANHRIYQLDSELKTISKTIWVKNKNFGEKSKFWSKIDILGKKIFRGKFSGKIKFSNTKYWNLG